MDEIYKPDDPWEEDASARNERVLNADRAHGLTAAGVLQASSNSMGAANLLLFALSIYDDPDSGRPSAFPDFDSVAFAAAEQLWKGEKSQAVRRMMRAIDEILDCRLAKMPESGETILQHVKRYDCYEGTMGVLMAAAYVNGLCRLHFRPTEVLGDTLYTIQLFGRQTSLLCDEGTANAVASFCSPAGVIESAVVFIRDVLSAEVAGGNPMRPRRAALEKFEVGKLAATEREPRQNADPDVLSCCRVILQTIDSEHNSDISGLLSDETIQALNAPYATNMPPMNLRKTAGWDPSNPDGWPEFQYSADDIAELTIYIAAGALAFGYGIDTELAQRFVEFHIDTHIAAIDTASSGLVDDPLTFIDELTMDHISRSRVDGLTAWDAIAGLVRLRVGFAVPPSAVLRVAIEHIVVRLGLTPRLDALRVAEDTISNLPAVIDHFERAAAGDTNLLAKSFLAAQALILYRIELSLDACGALTEERMPLKRFAGDHGDAYSHEATEWRSLILAVEHSIRLQTVDIDQYVNEALRWADALRATLHTSSVNRTALASMLALRVWSPSLRAVHEAHASAFLRRFKGVKTGDVVHNGDEIPLGDSVFTRALDAWEEEDAHEWFFSFDSAPNEGGLPYKDLASTRRWRLFVLGALAADLIDSFKAQRANELHPILRGAYAGTVHNDAEACDVIEFTAQLAETLATGDKSAMEAAINKSLVDGYSGGLAAMLLTHYRMDETYQRLHGRLGDDPSALNVLTNALNRLVNSRLSNRSYPGELETPENDTVDAMLSGLLSPESTLDEGDGVADARRKQVATALRISVEASQPQSESDSDSDGVVTHSIVTQSQPQPQPQFPNGQVDLPDADGSDGDNVINNDIEAETGDMDAVLEERQSAVTEAIDAGNALLSNARAEAAEIAAVMQKQKQRQRPSSYSYPMRAGEAPRVEVLLPPPPPVPATPKRQQKQTPKPSIQPRTVTRGVVGELIRKTQSTSTPTSAQGSQKRSQRTRLRYATKPASFKFAKPAPVTDTTKPKQTLTLTQQVQQPSFLSSSSSSSSSGPDSQFPNGQVAAAQPQPQQQQQPQHQHQPQQRASQEERALLARKINASKQAAREALSGGAGAGDGLADAMSHGLDWATRSPEPESSSESQVPDTDTVPGSPSTDEDLGGLRMPIQASSSSGTPRRTTFRKPRGTLRFKFGH